MAWSETEKSRVRELFQRGKTHPEIAVEMQRSVRSIDRILMRLGLRRHRKAPISIFRGLGTVPLAQDLVVPPDGHCRWFEDGKFCGKPSDMPSGWCDVHSWAVFGK